MGEVTIDVLVELAKDNRDASRVELQIYADTLTQYEEAAANIRKHGSVVAHPRTGAPLENPYLKVQAATGRLLSRMHLNGDRVMQLLQTQHAEPSAPEPPKRARKGSADESGSAGS